MTGLDDWTHQLEEMVLLVFPLRDSLDIRVSEVEVVD